MFKKKKRFILLFYMTLFKISWRMTYFINFSFLISSAKRYKVKIEIVFYWICTFSSFTFSQISLNFFNHIFDDSPVAENKFSDENFFHYRRRAKGEANTPLFCKKREILGCLSGVRPPLLPIVNFLRNLSR